MHWRWQTPRGRPSIRLMVQPKDGRDSAGGAGHRMSAMLLAGDVGGTKTTLGLFPLKGDPKTPKVETTFPSAKYPDLESIVREFLAQNRAAVRYASFGVAGPVIEGRAIITNLPWVVEERSLAASLHISDAHLMNDVEAIAKSVPLLARTDLATLNRGRPDPEGPVAIIAAGTGLGEAFITREGPLRRVHASEGGHADFAPTNESQVELLKHLLKRSDHVSYEDVCSGIGIRNIHAYFEKTSPPEQPSHAKELEVEDPVPIIAAAALSKSRRCKTCSLTMDTFASILGAEAGNLALKVLATGGVYIAGGIPRNVLPLLKNESFKMSFTKKGRMSQLVSRIQVHVVLRPGIALLGAASSGFESMRLSPKLSRELGEVREMKRVAEGARSLFQRDRGDA
jgi:glucokinase